MAQAYPPRIITRAKELWETVVPNTTPLSFEAVAKTLRTEFGIGITKKTTAEWCETYGWKRSTSLPAVPPPPAVQGTAPVLLAQPGSEPSDFSWERQKAMFLARLAGVADNCLAVVVDPVTGQPAMVFRDDDSKLKVGMAAVELIGKINSGKLDPPQDGDVVPQLDEEKVQTIIAFFLQKSAPRPKLGPVIDVTPEVVS